MSKGIATRGKNSQKALRPYVFFVPFVAIPPVPTYAQLYHKPVYAEVIETRHECTFLRRFAALA